MCSRKQQGDSRRKSSRGFTLIELLVVVAIIALLISILAPTLGKARAQARTTLCATRIAQMTKAMIMYADEFGETPPFIIRDSDVDDPFDNNGENRKKETWLAAASTMQRIYSIPQEDWYTAGDPKLPESGDLYTYTRYADLYRCPEFQRASNPNKDQNAFNYTRDILGRKFNVSDLANIRAEEILKLSQVYNSSQLPMMFDEAWNCYVGWPYEKGWVWGGHDPMMDLLNSCIGQYHGAPVRGWAWYPDSSPVGSINDALSDVLCQQGSVGYYDGHVGLLRDPIPNVEHSGGRADIAGGLSTYTNMYINWVAEFLYAQQGLVYSGLPQ
jgi:prepilin-type N-terminal cleavage/methylation domain-containing protein